MIIENHAINSATVYTTEVAVDNARERATAKRAFVATIEGLFPENRVADAEVVHLGRGKVRLIVKVYHAGAF